MARARIQRLQDSRSAVARSNAPDRAPERREAELSLLRLQRAVGNSATVALLESGQAKLQVGATADPAEHEADDVARAVVERLRGAHADPSVERQTAPLRIGRRAEVGASGGSLTAATESTLEAERRHGESLEATTRETMERAFDTDFSSVRVHTGPEAQELNERVQAKAFTVGNDIFFRSGLPDVRMNEGQELLAHELTHTIQQGSGRMSRSPAVQRMAFNNTNWSAAKSARVSSGGGMGVLIMADDQGPIVVKAGETMTSEAIVAARLLSTATEGGGEWKSSAPDTRTVDDDEAKQIHDRASGLLAGTPREKGILDELADNHGVMVYGFAKGKEVEDSLKEEKQTKKGLFGKRSLRKDSMAYTILKDPGLITSLGRASAADLMLGNLDRMIGYVNLQNIMVDLQTKDISLIDNVVMRTEAFIQDAPEWDIKAKDAFTVWAVHEKVRKLANDDFAPMAEFSIEEVQRQVSSNQSGVVRKEDKKALSSMFAQKQPILQQWFVQGLTEGKANVLGAMGDIRGYVRGIDVKSRKVVATSLIARRNFAAGGMDAEAAWAAAEEEAAGLFTWQPGVRRGSRGNG